MLLLETLILVLVNRIITNLTFSSWNIKETEYIYILSFSGPGGNKELEFEDPSVGFLQVIMLKCSNSRQERA